MSKHVDILKEIAKKNTIDIYMVGGSVRDTLLDRKVSDYDFAVKDEFDLMARLFADEVDGSYIEIHSDVARVVVEGVVFDFCKFKGENIHEDLKKRDFTINSLAIDLLSGGKIDAVNAMEDLNKKIIRMTYEDAFKDDPLRMLRAFRIKGQLGFNIEEKTLGYISKQAKELSGVSSERVIAELFKIFSMDNSLEILEEMEESGILEVIFPFISEMKRIGKCKYHAVDAFTHSKLALEFLEKEIRTLFHSKWGKKIEEHLLENIGGFSRLTILKVGTFLHDMGKPDAYKNDNGKVSFKMHDKLGAEKFVIFSKELNISKKQVEIIKAIIEGHMRILGMFKQNSSKSAMYRFFREYRENSIDIIICSLYDVLSTRSLIDESGESIRYREFISNLIDIYFSDFLIPSPIDGMDVINTLGIKGVEIGKILDAVREEVFNGRIKNKNEALSFIERYRR